MESSFSVRYLPNLRCFVIGNSICRQPILILEHFARRFFFFFFLLVDSEPLAGIYVPYARGFTEIFSNQWFGVEPSSNLSSHRALQFKYKFEFITITDHLLWDENCFVNYRVLIWEKNNLIWLAGASGYWKRNYNM